MPGVDVSASIAGRDPFPGSVRWCEDGKAGLRFREPLPPTMTERMAERTAEKAPHR